MTIVKAYYDGSAFVPIGFVPLEKGRVVNLSIVQEDAVQPQNMEKVTAFRQLTNDLREINKSEPLPQEFDDILASRADFTRKLDL